MWVFLQSALFAGLLELEEHPRDPRASSCILRRLAVDQDEALRVLRSRPLPFPLAPLVARLEYRRRVLAQGPVAALGDRNGYGVTGKGHGKPGSGQGWDAKGRGRGRASQGAPY